MCLERFFDAITVKSLFLEYFPASNHWEPNDFCKNYEINDESYDEKVQIYRCQLRRIRGI